MVAVLGLLVISCSVVDTSKHEPPPRVTQPGEVLIDRQARHQALAEMPAAERERWCALRTAAGPPPLPGLRALPTGPDNAGEPFALAVMDDAAAALAGDRKAVAALARLLDQWAQADALARIEQPTANTFYALDRTLLPTIVAFSIIRDDPQVDPEARARIQGWLGRLVQLRPPPRAGEMTAQNNHHYLRGSVEAAWGALVSDDAWFGHGLAAYRDAIAAMRPDGSLPLETRRGARALWYQRHAIASLVVIAEIAARQGVDLYGYAVDGRDLHQALRFLVDAIDVPSRVWPYAVVNDRPGGQPDYRQQDLGFLVTRGHGRHYMAWAEIYLARFPGRPESRRLLALLNRAGPGFRPMIDEYSGGDTTCMFAPAAPAAAGS
jgi:poly(beta-D-mannuronate) lyase